MAGDDRLGAAADAAFRRAETAHRADPRNAGEYGGLDAAAAAAESVLLSDYIVKVNRRRARQPRVIVLTNLAVYNFKRGSLARFRRRIALQDLGSLVHVAGCAELVLKAWAHGCGYDYRYDPGGAAARDALCGAIARAFEALTGAPLPVVVLDEAALARVGVTKAAARARAAAPASVADAALRRERAASVAAAALSGRAGSVAGGDAAVSRAAAAAAAAVDAGRGAGADEQGPPRHVLLARAASEAGPGGLHRYRSSDLERGRVIGSGSFGSVQIATLRGQRVAVKRLHGRGGMGRDEMLAEAGMMARVGFHDNVVPLLGVVEDPGAPDVELVTRFLSGGSVRDLLAAAPGPLPWGRVLAWTAQAAAGVMHLHAEGVIHRDIATRNFLVSGASEGDRLHVSDFGFARAAADAAAAGGAALGQEGPVKWEAPETLSRRAYSEATDAYAFGVAMFELATRALPWAGLSNLDAARAVVRGERPALPSSVDRGYAALMRACWAPDPAARPSFRAIHGAACELLATHETLSAPAPAAEGDYAAICVGDVVGGAVASPGTLGEGTLSASGAAGGSALAAAISNAVAAAAASAAPVDAFDAALAKLRPLDTRSAHLERWVDGSRGWLLGAVGEWLRGPRRVLWLHGDAGVGKSAIASRVAERFDAAALHYCQYYSAASRAAGGVVASLAAQLRTRLRGYAPAPGDLEPQEGDTPEVLFQRVIGAPLARSAPRGGVVLIVIDALDEAAAPGGGNAVLDMLRAVDAAPAWLKVFVTGRPHPLIAAVLRDAGVSLDARAPDNEADVRAALRALLTPLGGPLPVDACVEALAGRARGLFIYVRYVRERLVALGDRAARTEHVLSDLPDGMLAVFSESWARVHATAAPPLLQPLLEVLVASMEPIAFAFAAASAGLSPVDAATCLAALTGACVYTQLPDGRVRPNHKLVHEWLLSPEHGGVDAARGHAALARGAFSHVFGAPTPGISGGDGGRSSAGGGARDCDAACADDRYAFLYCLEHLAAAGAAGVITTSERDAQLARALTDTAFMDGVLACGGGAVLLAALRAAARAPCRTSAAVLPFAHWVSEVASGWAGHPLDALGPAAAGKYGRAVAVAAAVWAARRVPRLWSAAVVPVPSPSAWPPCGALHVALRGHGGTVHGVAAAGGLLASAGADGALRVWDAVTGELDRALRPQGMQGAGGEATSVDLGADAREAVVAYSAGAVCVWSLGGGGGGAVADAAVALDGGDQCVCARFGDGGRVVLGGGPGGLRLWARGGGGAGAWALVCGAAAHGVVRCVAFAPTAAAAAGVAGAEITAATGGDDRCASLWRVRAADGACAAALELLATCTGHGGAVLGLAYAPDGAALATASADKCVRLWDAARGAPVALLAGHTMNVYAVAFARDGAVLASGSGDRSIRLWDAGGSRECVRVLSGCSGAVTALAFAPRGDGDGRRLVSASRDGTVRLWDVSPDDGGAPSLPPPPPPRGPVLARAESSASGAAVASAGSSAAPGAARAIAVCGSPDGRRVAVVGDDGVVTVFDAAARRVQLAVAVPGGATTALAWAPGGASLAVGGADGGLYAVDVRGGGGGGVAVAAVWLGHTDRPLAVAFDAAGAALASGGLDRSVLVWVAEGGPPRLTLTGHTDEVRAVAFARGAGDARLASGGADRCVRLWDASTGAALAVLSGHALGVWGVAWRASDGVVVSCSGDKRVAAWGPSAPEGTPVRRMSRAHGGTARALCLSPDGGRVAGGGDDGAVVVSAVDSGACVAVAWLPGAVCHVSCPRSAGGFMEVLVGVKGAPVHEGACFVRLMFTGVPGGAGDRRMQNRIGRGGDGGMRIGGEGGGGAGGGGGSDCWLCGAREGVSGACCACGRGVCGACGADGSAFECATCAAGGDAAAHSAAGPAGVRLRGAAAPASPGGDDDAVGGFMRATFHDRPDDARAYAGALRAAGCTSRADLLSADLTSDLLAECIPAKMHAARAARALARLRGGAGAGASAAPIVCDACGTAARAAEARRRAGAGAGEEALAACALPCGGGEEEADRM